MQKHLTIVAAVDLDTRAVGVIRHAARLAALCQGDLLVVHVVDYPRGYESDHAPVHRPQQVLNDMVAHARGFVTDLILRLDLPTPRVAVRVEVGPVTDTLAALVTALQPRYALLGNSRWGALGRTSALASTLESCGGCEVLVVPRTAPSSRPGLIQRLQHWLAAGGSLPGLPTP